MKGGAHKPRTIQPVPLPHRATLRGRWSDRAQRFHMWVIDHAPIPLLTHAHEVGISVVLVIVSAPLLGGASGPPSIHQQVYNWVAIGWAWALLIGAVLTLVGLFGSRPRMEWAGQLFMGHGLSFYALALVLGAGWEGFLASSIFGILGLVSYWRSYKISHAPLVHYRLVQEARNAHEVAHVQRSLNRRGGAR